MKPLILMTLMVTGLFSSAAAASTPYPRFIEGKAVARIDGAPSTLVIDAKDAGATLDEGSASFRVRGGGALDLNLTCVNVVSGTSALATGVAGDGVTTYLIVVEDGGVGKDRFAVTQSPIAEHSCSAGIVPPVPEPTATSRGDLLIRGGA